ncbi:MAG: heavy-metal-associated domain-containing protein [Aureliella sp.]
MKPLAILVLFLAAQTALGEDVQVQYRLTGLFQPDRVEDLRRQASALPASDNSPVEVRLISVDYDTAVVTFSYDSRSENFKNRKPEQVLERINQLLRSASRGSFSVFPLSESKLDELQKERIAVAGLDCKGCAYGAYRSIALIDGVQRAVVSFKEGYVTAWIEPNKTSREALFAALEKAQVDVLEP